MNNRRMAFCRQPPDWARRNGNGEVYRGYWEPCRHCGKPAWRWFEATFCNTFECRHCGAYAPGNVGDIDFDVYHLPDESLLSLCVRYKLFASQPNEDWLGEYAVIPFLPSCLSSMGT